MLRLVLPTEQGPWVNSFSAGMPCEHIKFHECSQEKMQLQTTKADMLEGKRMHV